MHWKCLFVFKNTCSLKPATLWLLAVTFASLVFLCTLCISLFLPVCVFDAGIREQNFDEIDMLEDPLVPRPDPSNRALDQGRIVVKLRHNVTNVSREIRQLRATVRIYEKLGNVMEKDSSLATFGSKRHQNVLLTSLPHSGEILLGELFNQHRDVFYLFEPFHSLRYYKENRPPEVYNSMLRNFLQGIFSCDFGDFNFYAEFLSRHYRAFVHRLASRTLSSPPLCPEMIRGRYYNIRYCTRLRPPTLTAICKLHDYTVVKTTQLVDLERLAQLNDGIRDPFRVVELVRDPRAILYAQLRENRGNLSDSWLAKEARKICTQQLRNKRYLEHPPPKRSDRYVVIKYEELISEPFGVLENLCAFLGLSHSRHAHSWFSEVLKDGFAWPMVGENDGTGNHARKKLNLTRSMTEWQSGLDLKQIRSIERECYSMMKVFGYNVFA
jgi:hypothetical protein